MKKLNTILLLLSISFGFGQEQVKLEKLPKLEIFSETKDSIFVYTFKDISELRLVIHHRLNETFDMNDTLHRDYIESQTKKTTLDNLYGLNQSDYTGSYDLLDCYYVKTSTNSYSILSFVDLFTLGSNQQVFFVVFKQIGNEWTFYDNYQNMHNMPIDNIVVVTKKKDLLLKGKFLKKIKRKPSTY